MREKERKCRERETLLEYITKGIEREKKEGKYQKRDQKSEKEKRGQKI
jgi:hypothetical protein